MDFIEFIKNLSIKEKENYEKYSKVRGKQLYKIVFESLKKIEDNVTYSDVNSFIKYDKALKDILFKYLGTLEEYIKAYLLSNYDFEDYDTLEKDRYNYFKHFPKITKKNNISIEITELYKRYALNFGDMINLLKDYLINEFDIEKLDNVLELRNSVMHHMPLLFDNNFNSNVIQISKQINDLIFLLPNGWNGIKNELDKISKITKTNIKEDFRKLLIELE